MQQPIGTGLVILRLHADQHQQALIDGPDDLTCDLHPGLADPLQQTLHYSASGASFSNRCAMLWVARTSASAMPGSPAE